MSHVRPDKLADFAREKLSNKKMAEVFAHLQTCQSCRQALDRIEGAQSAMRDILKTPVPEVSAVRTTATLRWMRIAPPRQVRPAFFVALGLSTAAAAVLFVVGRGGTPSPTSAPVQVAVPAPRPEVKTVEAQAMVTLLGGKVELERAGARTAVEMGSLLRGGDKLHAGGAARLAAQWSEGSGFLLAADSMLTIGKLQAQAQRFALGRGKVDMRVSGPADLAVETTSHTVRVRGTWFTVAGDGSRTTVEVFEGAVEVAERDGSAVTVLQAPARGVFGPGRATTGPLTAREVAERRLKSELNLLGWAAREKSGVLAIASDPSGTLAVDGVELGPTPLSVRRPIGRHYIEITRKDFTTIQRWMDVGFEPGELRTALVSRVVHPEDSAPVPIEEMVRARGRQIRGCYERSLKRDPSLAGTVSLQVRVGGSGRVSGATVESSTLVDASEVGECLAREARSWKFATGRNSTVVYPFVFRPQ
jgi:ferric-dicitrate binding protein FerR (iron transport regulator)